MTKTIASLIVAAVAFGSASSAFADGNYYNGVSEAPLFQGRAASTAGTAAAVNNGGDGTYYTGASRTGVDAVSTGSIVRGAAPQTAIENGDYYPGLSR
ncbi:hypothetical protein SAMN05880582_102247 [Rhizobium sp. RU20A]|uniref:hypothetical protein n=1 Tax=Rhizobium sp. RU20A TaxID=1907412 RepID=UPI0009555E64|nr:hypothetical protein [Rhizobium sp. RU20A]SIQ59727.1 hypothetical protein SAMN05880582_102247 [Rhizobium sp. RU20A]